MRYLIIAWQAEHSLSAPAPDLPGCVTTGATRAEALANMREAIEPHLQGLHEDGDPIPEPSSDLAFVEVTLASSEAYTGNWQVAATGEAK